MYKIILYLLIIVFGIRMLALQLDEERAMYTLFWLKHSVNRASHAAAQQLEEQTVSSGKLRIDTDLAYEAAMQYLQMNLQLDSTNSPLSGSILHSQVVVEHFVVINSDHSFPYTYKNPDVDYEVTLSRPGVILIVKVEYPRIFNVMEPIQWVVKGASEVVLF